MYGCRTISHESAETVKRNVNKVSTENGGTNSNQSCNFCNEISAVKLRGNHKTVPLVAETSLSINWNRTISFALQTL